MLNNTIQTVTAFAPATCANVIVGFDVLGLAIAGVGDQVTLTRRDDAQLVLEKILSADDLPTDPRQNVVAVVIAQLLADLQLRCGFTISLRKGIPLSSGMGGSAASAVAALIAVNGFLKQPLSLPQLAHYALQGEAFCSGQAHADNIVPALYGGITLLAQLEPLQVVALPIPDIICVVVHPHLQVTTREARKALASTVPLALYTQQSAHLASFISALYQHDLSLLQQSLRDVLIEPQRQSLVVGFATVQQAALQQGALGVSLSGSGPSMLAFARNQGEGQQIAMAMQQAFRQHGVESEAHLSAISQQGAHIVSVEKRQSMRFHSTINSEQRCDFVTAMLTGLAVDGGLYIPERFPFFDLRQFSADWSYSQFAHQLLCPFISGPLQEQLASICAQAFNFAVPTRQVNSNTWLLELFHGPTLSFKDFGARFLAQCLQRTPLGKPLTILVATSGDTGSAVAAAFFQKSPIRVIVLFPKGKISQRQQQQITCWQDNVTAVAVDGAFDDCQRLVKAAFSDPWWQQTQQLSTANSINIGRLLPQMTYYAYTSYHFYRQHGCAPGFIIPSGNLGNVTAAYWAKLAGFPLGDIVIATNANRPVTNYLATAEYQALPTEVTLANAMDVGNPSNFARLQALFPNFDDFKAQVRAIRVDDVQITEAIQQAYHQHQLIICPHTATGYFARQQLNDQPWIIAATAHPSKFNNIIEPILGVPVPPTLELSVLLDRPQHHELIPAELAALTALMLSNK